MLNYYKSLQQSRSFNIPLVNSVVYFAFFCAFMEKLTFYYKGQWYFDSGYTMTSPYLSTSRMFGVMAFFLFIVTVGINLLQKKNFLGKKMFLVIGFCLILNIFWSIHALLEGVSPMRLIFISGSPLIFLYVLYFWLGMQKNLYRTFGTCCKIFAPAALILALYYEYDFAKEYGFSIRTDASPIYIWFQIGIFATVYILFLDNYKKSVWYEWLCILLTIWAGVLTGSRSYVILSLILFYFFLPKQLGWKPFSIKNILVFVTMLILLIATLEWLFVDTYNLYSSRLNEDTRTSQYNTFFEQVSVGELIVGGGVWASYSFSGISNYIYFDNQLMLLMFRYGLVGLILYQYIMFKTMITSIFTRKSNLWVVLLLWELALLGFSVYFPIDTGLMHAIVLIAAGQCHMEKYQNTNNNSLENLSKN